MYETKNFKQATDPKLACSCCGKGTPSIALLLVLEDVKRHFTFMAGVDGKASVNINCCSRCTTHNAKEGGAKVCRTLGHPTFLSSIHVRWRN